MRRRAFRARQYKAAIGGGQSNRVQPRAAYSVIGSGQGNLVATGAYGGVIGGGAHSESLMALARSAAALISEVYQRDLDIGPHGNQAWPAVFRLYEGDGHLPPPARPHPPRGGQGHSRGL